MYQEMVIILPDSNPHANVKIHELDTDIDIIRQVFGGQRHMGGGHLAHKQKNFRA